MKTIEFDDYGNMTVTVITEGVDEGGNAVILKTQHDIQPEQLKAHLPMFKADMTPAQLAKANEIIARQ